MCGLAGYSLISKCFVLDDWSTAACQALSHRGPDDSGAFEDPEHGICLIHTRLSIQDPSSLGHQPMRSPDNRVVLTFNGELYNFRELRSELEAEGCTFFSESDTEVLLALYLNLRQKSPFRLTSDVISAMLQRLNGIFAFALWDRDCQSMLLARDAFGVKPLYLHRSGVGLYFASESKALRSANPSLDPLSLDRYLTFLWSPGKGTPDYGVRKLGPGEAIWVSQGEIQEQFVWYRIPSFRLLASTRSVIPQALAIRSTEKHLRQAVYRQLVADVPVGAFLSGGLDSSSVVAFAREQNPDIRCFTIECTGSSKEGNVVDLPYARRVAAHLNVPLEIVRIDAARMAEDLPAMVVQLDEPLADPAPLNVLYISRLAREQGIKVLLSGAGGTTFSLAIAVIGH